MLLYHGGWKYEGLHQPFQMLLYTTATALLCSYNLMILNKEAHPRLLSRENWWEFNGHCREVSTSIFIYLIERILNDI